MKYVLPLLLCLAVVMPASAANSRGHDGRGNTPSVIVWEAGNPSVIVWEAGNLLKKLFSIHGSSSDLPVKAQPAKAGGANR